MGCIHNERMVPKEAKKKFRKRKLVESDMERKTKSVKKTSKRKLVESDMETSTSVQEDSTDEQTESSEEKDVTVEVDSESDVINADSESHTSFYESNQKTDADDVDEIDEKTEVDDSDDKSESSTSMDSSESSISTTVSADVSLLSECEKPQIEREDNTESDDLYTDTDSVDSDTAPAQQEDESSDVDEPIDDVSPQSQNPENPLSTLASAALCMGASNSDMNTTEEKPSVWCDVGVFKSPFCKVSSFYPNLEDRTNEYVDLNSDTLPDFENILETAKIPLEPGMAYKFRVCAVNACGRSPWSEVHAFKTHTPGYPENPLSIGVSSCPEGVNIYWLPPNSTGQILGYSVRMAIKKFNEKNEEIMPDPKMLVYEKLYEGQDPRLFISNEVLQNAYIDTSARPAIIFKIAAQNEKGYGPESHVRWLQHSRFKK